MRRTTHQRPALPLTETTPHTVIHTHLHRELQTVSAYRTFCADLFRFLNLEQRQTGGPDWEEQLWILAQTCRSLTPARHFNVSGVTRHFNPSNCGVNTTGKPFET